MNISTLIKPAILVAAFALAGAASAKATSFAINPSTFIDTINFKVEDALANVAVDFSFKDLKLTVDGTKTYFDPSLSWSLDYKPNKVGDVTTGTAIGTSTGGQGTGVLDFTSLQMGTYALTLTGDWAARSGVYFKNESYVSGSVNLLGHPTITPVPEPETYAMLLAGLGLMGAIAKRRKAKQA
jgi:hypothetical protein